MTANYVGRKGLHIRASLLFAFMLVNAVTTLANESMRLVESDSGKTVEIYVGEELDVILAAMPTAGYVWEIEKLDSAVLKHHKTEHLFKDKPIGAQSMETLGFQAIGVGKSELKLIFHRPFEKNTPPSKTFEIIVIIKK